MINRIFEPHIMENPALPFIFHLDSALPGPQMWANWHSNIEILYCVSGAGSVKYELSEYPLAKGELCIINSNVLHSVQSADEMCYHCLIIDRGFCADNGIATDDICFQAIVRNLVAVELFEQIIAAYADDGVCRIAKIRQAVLGLLIYLRENHTLEAALAAETEASLAIERVKQCMVYINRHFTHALTLDEIAQQAGVSKFHLSREFKKVTGQTIFTYLNMIRCKEAKRLIVDGMSVSAAAISCGFDNLSYFTRVYKRYTGQLPSGKNACKRMN